MAANKELYGCLPSLQPNGDLYVSHGVETILQSLYVILVTLPESRPWQPKFGIGILRKVFDLFTEDTQTQLQSEIKTQFELWENRVTYKSVDVGCYKNEYNENVIEINVSITFNGEDFTHRFIFPNNVELTNVSLYDLVVRR